MESGFSKAGFARTYMFPALWLFAIPVLGVLFSQHALDSWDAEFLQAVQASIEGDAAVEAAQREAALAFYADTPASVLCRSDEGHARLPDAFVENACGDYNQLSWIGDASRVSIGLGLLSILVVLGCAALSFGSRGAQYLSFVTGWQFLRLASTGQVILQSFVAVMLSFWVTAFFFERYFVKLIAIAGILALVACAMVIKAIFARPDDTLTVDGELLTRDSSPQLWSRIAAICERLKTAVPDHIIGGIDDNFFVTEHDVVLGGQTLKGRTLFVSLSLLQRLDKTQADAILAHEMAHFSGGDTQHSKKLTPLLSRYHQYLGALYEGGLSRPVFYLMLFFRGAMELSLGRASRQRELRADRIAADTTSPQSMAAALLKVTAYSAYRHRVEEGLFDRNSQHGELDIANRIAAGFADYATGERLLSDVKHESTPHPFDSHPSLNERIDAVGATVSDADVSGLVTATSEDTWFAEIGDAAVIEGRLWAAYEEGFRSAHEVALAYRYLPATPEQREHVERFFPEVAFSGKDGGTACTVTCSAIHYRDWDAAIEWSDITNIKAEDPTFGGKHLKLYQGTKTPDAKLPLGKLESPDDEVTAVIERYFSRYLTARQHQEDSPPT